MSMAAAIWEGGWAVVLVAGAVIFAARADRKVRARG